MSIKSKIQQLNLQERRQLSHAFDCGISQYIEFGDNEFIGVHLEYKKAKQLQIKEQVGVWSYGRIINEIFSQTMSKM